MGETTSAQQWVRIFEEAHGFDTWGQLEEARESYAKLSRLIQDGRGSLPLSQAQLVTLDQFVSVISARLNGLATGALDGVNSSAMAPLKDVLRQLFQSSESCPFPGELLQYTNTPGASAGRVGAASSDGIKTMGADDDDDDDGDVDVGGGGASMTSSVQGTLLPALPASAGTTIEIRIDKIGLKDAERYIDPFIDVSVVDAVGRPIGTRQSTPGSSKPREAQHVLFGHTVHLQASLDEMGASSAVIFEFIHYKPKDGKNSVRCWCFVDHEVRAVITLQL